MSHTVNTSPPEIAISVRKLNKTFHLPRERHAGVKQLLINTLKGKHERGSVAQKVLKDISFEVEKGDFLGIVGRNGSGKSTLLKLLAEIYEPDSGEVVVNGSLVPFIELGVGFNPELTGRENIFMNGALLGFSREEMLKMYKDIVAFAELEGFMDQKLKNYSSGMQVRLAFSIAIRAKSDILILDEVLAVGDESFQRKCYQYFAKIKKNKQTVILVTHNMDVVLQFCNKAMLIDKGHKTVIGNPLEIAQIYRELNNEEDTTVEKETNESSRSDRGTKYIEAKASVALDKTYATISIDLKPKLDIEDPIVALGIYKDTGEQIYRWVSDERGDGTLDLTKPVSIVIELSNVLPVGVFTGTLYVRRRDRTIDYAIFYDIVRFEVKNYSVYQYDVFWKLPERTTINGQEV